MTSICKEMDINIALYISSKRNRQFFQIIKSMKRRDIMLEKDMWNMLNKSNAKSICCLHFRRNMYEIFIHIFKEKDEGKISYITKGFLSSEEIYEIEIDFETTKIINDQLSNIVIPLVPKEEVWGLDGCSYELIIEKGMYKSNISWWSEAEQGWESLNKVIETIFACLPENIRNEKY